MVPKAVSDAGYTAIGLGVLAVEQVQTRRRETRARLETEARRAKARLGGWLGTLKTTTEPLAGQLQRLPQRLPALARPVKKAVDESRGRIEAALQRRGSGPAGGARSS